MYYVLIQRFSDIASVYDELTKKYRRLAFLLTSNKIIFSVMTYDDEVCIFSVLLKFQKFAKGSIFLISIVGFSIFFTFATLLLYCVVVSRCPKLLAHHRRPNHQLGHEEHNPV